MRRRAVSGEASDAADGNVAPAPVQTSSQVDAANWTVVVCTRPGLTVSAREHGRSFAPGDALDLTAAASPHCTWRDAIGDHLTDFFIPRDGEGA